LLQAFPDEPLIGAQVLLAGQRLFTFQRGGDALRRPLQGELRPRAQREDVGDSLARQGLRNSVEFDERSVRALRAQCDLGGRFRAQHEVLRRQRASDSCQKGASLVHVAGAHVFAGGAQQQPIAQFLRVLSGQPFIRLRGGRVIAVAREFFGLLQLAVVAGRRRPFRRRRSGRARDHQKGENAGQQTTSHHFRATMHQQCSTGVGLRSQAMSSSPKFEIRGGRTNRLPRLLDLARIPWSRDRRLIGNSRITYSARF
jgi:hypothetical protein